MGNDEWARSKKLKGAGAYWAAQALEQAAGPDKVADDLARFGASDAAAAYRAAPCGYLVEPENWPATDAWRAVQSQFRRTGLRYEGVYYGLMMAGIQCTPDLFLRLRLIEAGALTTLAEQSHD